MIVMGKRPTSQTGVGGAQNIINAQGRYACETAYRERPTDRSLAFVCANMHTMHRPMRLHTPTHTLARARAHRSSIILHDNTPLLALSYWNNHNKVNEDRAGDVVLLGEHGAADARRHRTTCGSI